MYDNIRSIGEINSLVVNQDGEEAPFICDCKKYL